MGRIKIHHIIIQYRILILISILGLTAFMAYQAQKVELDYKMAQLLPQTDQAFIDYKAFKKQFGEDANLILLGINDTSILKLKTFNTYYDLSNSIADIKVVDVNDSIIKGAKTVFSLSHLYELKKHPEACKLQIQSLFKQKPQTQNELDSVLNHLHALPFYENLLFKKTKCSYVTILAVSLQNEIVNSKSRIDFVNQMSELAEQFTKETGVEIHYSGLPFIRTHIMAKVKKELSLFIGLAALVLAVILYLFFKSFRAVLTALIIVGISVVWVFGFMGIFDYKITILTGLIPPLIIVIGIPNSIFLLNKYHLECTTHGSKEKALEKMIKKIGGVIFLSNLTTAAGFATFVFTSSIILVEFGIVAAANIFGLFILSITIFPIILSFQSKPKAKHTKHLESKVLYNALKWLVVSTLKHRRSIYLGTGVLIIFSIIGISMIKISGNVVDDIPKDDSIYKDLMFFEEQYGGVLPFEIMIDTKKGNGVFTDNATTLYKMRKLEKVLSRDSIYAQYFSKPISILDGLRYMYQAHKGGDSKYFTVPTPAQLSQLKKYQSKETKSAWLENNAFIDSTSQITRMTVEMANINTKQIQILQDSLRSDVDKIFPIEDYKVSFTGTSIVFLKGTNFLIRNLFISLAIAIGLISLFIALMFKSFRMVLISIFPNLIPLLFTAGIMGYFGINIKPSTILVFSIAFGISVDDSIHYLAKYRQELKLYNGRIKFSVIEAIKESGVSMIYTSIVLFFGFSIFAASSFGGTIALGVLVSLTLLVAMITNLILLPALLMSLEKAKAKEGKKKRKKK